MGSILCKPKRFQYHLLWVQGNCNKLENLNSNAMPESFQPSSMPYGIPYGRWTVRWWQWLVSNSTATSPVLDSTGAHAASNQPPKDVWFLAGILAGTDSRYPHRNCAIPEGRSILFPVINCEANSVEYPELKTPRDLEEHVKNDENTIIKRNCLIDGHAVEVYRVPSDPSVFTLAIPPDNILGVKGAATVQACADGYWVFLKPLSRGKHWISFEGSCELGRLNTGATYELTVT
jgi:hypothetical protein